MDRAAPDNGNPRKNDHWRVKRAHFSALIDPSRGRGLEIGALDLPMIEPQEGECDFADFNSQAELIEIAKELPGVSPERLALVTHSIRDGYDHLPRDYDWIAASHVIEHVPNVLGWLRTLGEHLKPGGILFLTIPDKRFTFDIYRPETTFSQIVARDRAQLTRPSFEQIFDAHYCTVPILPHDVWVGNAVPERPYSFEVAMEQAALGEASYRDSHCSVFSPESFGSIAGSLVRHGLIPFRDPDLRATPFGHWDFTAALTRT